MTEQSTIDLINKHSGTSLVLSDDKFNSYDAEDDDYIVEIKNRRKYYDKKLIEASKLFVNYQKSQIKCKMFLYVVTDESGVYIYNITKNIETIVRLSIKPIVCPMTTDFNKSHKILKYSYVLGESLSTKINY